MVRCARGGSVPEPPARLPPHAGRGDSNAPLSTQARSPLGILVFAAGRTRDGARGEGAGGGMSHAARHAAAQRVRGARGAASGPPSSPPRRAAEDRHARRETAQRVRRSSPEAALTLRRLSISASIFASGMPSSRHASLRASKPVSAPARRQRGKGRRGEGGGLCESLARHAASCRGGARAGSVPVPPSRPARCSARRRWAAGACAAGAARRSLPTHPPPRPWRSRSRP